MTPDRLVAIAAGGALSAAIVWFFFGRRRTVAAGSEITIVVDGGYAPDLVVARKGRPLRLLFDRRDSGPCTDEVVLADFGLRRRLPTGQKTAIDVVPERAGDYSFACGMNMLHGTIRVVE
jgi:P-type Cu+ transporter